jgi:type II secretory pathway pseudopilin PulG
VRPASKRDLHKSRGAHKCGAHARRDAGFTLVQLLLVLAAIAVLALLLPAAIARVVSQARVDRARAETRVIAAAISQFRADTGFYPLWSRARDGGPGTEADRVQLLVGEGNIPLPDGPKQWPSAAGLDRLDHQLITNAPGYRRATSGTSGWNGPYLASDVGPDPWGNRYMVNVGLVSGDATTGPQPAPPLAVWVISAGPDGKIETPYRQAAVTATLSGDDVGARVR